MEHPELSRMKTFFCECCQSEVNCLRWKSISSQLNGPEYRCDSCWEKLDGDLEKMVREKCLILSK